MTWSNIISLLRLPLGGAFLATQRTDARIAILIAAAATDYADGWVARRLHQQSTAGELVDPVADKIFVLCTLAAFLRSDVVRVWELALLLLRDIFASFAFILATAMRLPIHFQARFSGKVVTTLQLAAVLIFTTFPRGARAAVLVTAAAAIWAIADYTRFGVRSLRAGAHAG